MSQEHFTENLLALSGIQHFFFCRRQWALIHVEMQWRENVLTVEGKQLHERVDDPFFNESRNGTVIARAVPVASYSLGLFGVCDVVEFKPSATEVAEAMRLPKRDGLFVPAPVEYKR
ncbi:MAG: Dna2/Cas4 domain-containing protein, partial [Candidatus Bathyarchaeia archaeon]